uniref:Uncharacterized protein n=1 Tax=Ascaris lumbricoides TaxID=6252 RepID=A0A0M3HJE1_ASCLU
MAAVIENECPEAINGRMFRPFGDNEFILSREPVHFDRIYIRIILTLTM